MCEEEEDDIQVALERVRKLRDEFGLPHGAALAVVLYNLPDDSLKKIAHRNCCEAYKYLSKEEKKIFLERLIKLHEDLPFWKGCLSASYSLSNEELQDRCYEQIIRLTRDINIKQLSYVYNHAHGEAVKMLAIAKIRDFLK